MTIGMFIANIFVNLGLIKLYGFTGAAYAQSASRIALFLFLIGECQPILSRRRAKGFSTTCWPMRPMRCHGYKILWV